jgi:hypothetical protein
MDRVPESLAQTHLWEQGAEVGLGVTRELVDLDFPDAKFGVDSFCAVYFVLAHGNFGLFLIELHAFEGVLQFEVSFESGGLLFVLDPLLFLQQVVLQLLDLELGFSLNTFDFQLVLLVVVVGLLLVSFYLFVVLGCQFAGLVKFVGLGHLQVGDLLDLVDLLLVGQFNLLGFQLGGLAELCLKILEQFRR